jgi:hypothetical protein
MKQQLLSTLLASALVVSYAPVASAAALNLTHSFISSIADAGSGVVTPLAVPGSSTYGHTFIAPTTTIPGSPGSGYGFYDDFVFTVAGATTNSVTSTIDFYGLLEITNLQVRLFNASGNVFPVLTSPASCPGVGCTLINSWSSPISYGPTTGTVAVLPGSVLGAGTYVLEVRGNVVGAAGGSYSGVLNLAPVPVPAAAWLFGSGIVGLLATRRRK